MIDTRPLYLSGLAWGALVVSETPDDGRQILLSIMNRPVLDLPGRQPLLSGSSQILICRHAPKPLVSVTPDLVALRAHHVLTPPVRPTPSLAKWDISAVQRISGRYGRDIGHTQG